MEKIELECASFKELHSLNMDSLSFFLDPYPFIVAITGTVTSYLVIYIAACLLYEESSDDELSPPRSSHSLHLLLVGSELVSTFSLIAFTWDWSSWWPLTMILLIKVLWYGRFFNRSKEAARQHVQ